AGEWARNLRLPISMYAGGSLFLIAIGAILFWAIRYRVPGVDLRMVGLILMIIGAVGVLFGALGAAFRHRRLT
ncbi:MAG: DUF6458 family protein, partial [Polyangia bacterium]